MTLQEQETTSVLVNYTQQNKESKRHHRLFKLQVL